MSTPKTLDEVRDALSCLRFDIGHDYQGDPGKIKGLGLSEGLLPRVMREIGPGWKAITLRSVPAVGDIGQWLRVDIVRDVEG